MSDTERLYRRNETTTGVAFDEGLRKYMIGVYNYMAMGVAATALIGLFFMMNQGALQLFAGTPLRWAPFAGIFLLGFAAPKMIFNGSSVMAHGAYWLYVACWGLMVGPMVAIYTNSLGLGLEVVKAFFITSSIFAAMSVYGYTTKRDLAPMAKFFFMATIGLLIAIVVNIFLGSELLSFITSALVVLVFSGVTAWETQMIKNLYVQGAGEQNDRASIFGAFALYGTFVTLFVHVLNLLALSRD